MSFAKTVCPITREEFSTHAQPLPVQLNGLSMLAEVKHFSTGSMGWSISDKREVHVNGKPVRVQIGLNITIIGSKEAS